MLTLTSRVALPDGSEMHEDRRSGPRAAAERLGTEAGEDLRRRIGPNFLDGGRGLSLRNRLRGILDRTVPEGPYGASPSSLRIQRGLREFLERREIARRPLQVT